MVSPMMFADALVDTTNFILVDQIEDVVYGQEDLEIITKSDIDRPSLGGGFRTKDEIIFEREVLLDAKKHHIPQDEEAIDAYLAQIQRENNLSEKELEEIFTNSGYTLEEGREQLQRMQTINTMLDVKIRSNLIIPRKDVEEYYKNNPTIIEATYTLQRAFVAQSPKMSAEKQLDVLTKYAKTGKGASGIVWSDPFTVNHSDIAASKQFIYDMEPGQMSVPQEVSGGFEMFKLVEKTSEIVKSLEDSYREIVDILRRPKYDELMEKYKDALMKNASIVYFN
jgi:parvulin-like peptidyl-prolyl isomerase